MGSCSAAVNIQYDGAILWTSIKFGQLFHHAVTVSNNQMMTVIAFTEFIHVPDVSVGI
jgi:hypothetical protein